MNKCKMFSFVCFFLSLTTIAFADKIYLSNGQVLEGEIFKEGKYSVNIRVDGEPRNIFRHKIDKIEHDKTMPSGEDFKQNLFGKIAIPGVEEKITEEKKQLIIRLLEANGARDSMHLIFNQIITQAPEDTRSELRDLLRADEVILELVPIYASYYYEEELRALIAFYRSETGQKHIQLTPLIMEDTLARAAEYFQDKVDKRDKEVTQERKYFESGLDARQKALDSR